MLDYPKTLEEAQKYRYHQWAGNPKGVAYQEGRCVMEVWASGPGIFCYQCSRKNGYGPSGLYCKQHSEKIKDRVKKAIDELIAEFERPWWKKLFRRA